MGIILPVTDTNTDEPADTCKSLMISTLLSWISVIRLMSCPFRDDPGYELIINYYSRTCPFEKSLSKVKY